MSVNQIMIKLNDFINMGFGITWTLIKIGFKGTEQFLGQINANDVINFALNQLEEDIEQYEEVVLLADENQINDLEISNLLNKLSQNESCDWNKEFRKWRAVYVAKYLLNPSDNYIQGLIDLGDIWAMFDFPHDAPHVYQGRNNAITPEQYYTQENYLKLLEEHKKWLEKEKITLIYS